jgi:hypothetical protein
MIDINEIKVDDNITTFNDFTLFVGNKIYPDLQLFYPYETGSSWNYKVMYCTLDYILLEMNVTRYKGIPEIHILNTYRTIKMTNECNK